MKYCKRCLNVSSRPNVIFNEAGLCFPCQIHDETFPLKRDFHGVELSELLSFARNSKRSKYDCIVGVSGGKDSTRQAIHLRDKFKLNPLLVSMNYPPEQISKRGVDNLSNLIALGFDCINIGCSPKTWRSAMRIAFLNFGNWAKATEMALFASVPRVAVAHQIKLIWWGESAAAQLGEMGVKGNSLSDGNRLKYSNTLAGGDISWLFSNGLEARKLLQFVYPSDVDMDRAGLRIVFMDYFMNDFSSLMNGNYSALRGLSVREPNPLIDGDFFGTSMLDEDFINLNMHLRYLKFGWGRASDIVNLEIRAGRMSREEGVDLVQRYDGSYDPRLVPIFCDFIDISLEEFWNTVDRFANRDLFEKVGVGSYRPKFRVGVGL